MSAFPLHQLTTAPKVNDAPIPPGATVRKHRMGDDTTFKTDPRPAASRTTITQRGEPPMSKATPAAPAFNPPAREVKVAKPSSRGGRPVLRPQIVALIAAQGALSSPEITERLNARRESVLATLRAMVADKELKREGARRHYLYSLRAAAAPAARSPATPAPATSAAGQRVVAGIVIERGIPAPTRTGDLRVAIEAMQVGESLTHTANPSPGHYKRKIPGKFVVRCLGKKHWRLWRVA